MRWAMMAGAAVAAIWATVDVSQAQGRGSSPPLVRETRAVQGFDEINLGVPAHLVIAQGARESLVVRAFRPTLAELETVVRDGRLLLRLRDQKRTGRARDLGRIVFEVTVVDLAGLEVDGSGSVRIGPLFGKQLALAVKGSTTVDAKQLIVDELEIAIAGSGSVRAAGRVATQIVAMSGSGDFVGEGVASERASVVVSGSGSVRLWVRRTLAVTIAGSGSVRYRGNPHVTRQISGSGSVAPLGR